MSEEKIKSITFEYETYVQKLSGEWAEQWLKWVNGVVTFNEIRSGNIGANATKHEFHNHWEMKTKNEVRKEKLNDIKKITNRKDSK